MLKGLQRNANLPVNASVQGPLGDSVPVATLTHLVMDICMNGAAIFVRACLMCRVDYGHAEAAHKYGSDPRKYNVMSKKFVTDDQGHVKVISASLYTLLSTLKFMLSKLVSCNEYLGDTERDLCAVLLSKFPYTMPLYRMRAAASGFHGPHLSNIQILGCHGFTLWCCGVLHTSLFRLCNTTARCKTFNQSIWLQGIEIVHVKWEASKDGGRPSLVELEGTNEVLPADLVLLAMGFLGPEATLADALGLELDPRSNFKVSHASHYMRLLHCSNALTSLKLYRSCLLVSVKERSLSCAVFMVCICSIT